MVMANGEKSAVQIATEAVRQAERRRDEQARIVSEMVGPPSEVAFAERVLAEMNHTLDMARVYQSILEGMDD